MMARTASLVSSGPCGSFGLGAAPLGPGMEAVGVGVLWGAEQGWGGGGVSQVVVGVARCSWCGSACQRGCGGWLHERNWRRRVLVLLWRTGDLWRSAVEEHFAAILLVFGALHA